MDYLIKKRENNNTIEYLVKWTGKTHNENSWVTLCQITEQSNKQFLLSTYANNQQKEQKTNRKGRKIKKQHLKNYTVKLGKLKLSIPCISKQHNHWIFGDRIKKLLKRDHTLQKYNVKWTNDKQTWQDQNQLLQRQPKIMCNFLQKQLGFQF